MEKKMTNRLGQRSKEMLTEAFFSLLGDNPSQEITIKKLCEKADVTRPTFYSHYQVIKQIPYEFIFRQIKELFLDNVEGVNIDGSLPNYGMRERDYLTDFFKFWDKNELVFKQLKSAGMQAMIIDTFKELLLISEDITLKGLKMKPASKNYMMDYIPSLFYRLLDLWFECGKIHTIDEMIDIYNIHAGRNQLLKIIDLIERNNRFSK